LLLLPYVRKRKESIGLIGYVYYFPPREYQTRGICRFDTCVQDIFYLDRIMQHLRGY
jgi:hypothetical protein